MFERLHRFTLVVRRIAWTAPLSLFLPLARLHVIVDLRNGVSDADRLRETAVRNTPSANLQTVVRTE